MAYQSNETTCILKGVGSFLLLFEQRLSIADSVLIDTVNLIGKS